MVITGRRRRERRQASGRPAVAGAIGSRQLHDQLVGFVAGEAQGLGEPPHHLTAGQALGQQRGGLFDSVLGAIGLGGRNPGSFENDGKLSPRGVSE